MTTPARHPLATKPSSLELVRPGRGMSASRPGLEEAAASASLEAARIAAGRRNEAARILFSVVDASDVSRSIEAYEDRLARTRGFGSWARRSRAADRVWLAGWKRRDELLEWVVDRRGTHRRL